MYADKGAGSLRAAVSPRATWSRKAVRVAITRVIPADTPTAREPAETFSKNPTRGLTFLGAPEYWRGVCVNERGRGNGTNQQRPGRAAQARRGVAGQPKELGGSRGKDALQRGDVSIMAGAVSADVARAV